MLHFPVKTFSLDVDIYLLDMQDSCAAVSGASTCICVQAPYGVEHAGDTCVKLSRLQACSVLTEARRAHPVLAYVLTVHTCQGSRNPKREPQSCS